MRRPQISCDDDLIKNERPECRPTDRVNRIATATFTTKCPITSKHWGGYKTTIMPHINDHYVGIRAFCKRTYRRQGRALSSPTYCNNTVGHWPMVVWSTIASSLVTSRIWNLDSNQNLNRLESSWFILSFSNNLLIGSSQVINHCDSSQAMTPTLCKDGLFAINNHQHLSQRQYEVNDMHKQSGKNFKYHSWLAPPHDNFHKI